MRRPSSWPRRYEFCVKENEHVWNDLKNNGIGKKVITGPAQMKRDVISHLRFLQKSPARILSFFQAPITGSHYSLRYRNGAIVGYSL